MGNHQRQKPQKKHLVKTPGLEPGTEEGSEADSSTLIWGDLKTEAPGAVEEVTEPVPAAEGFNKERGLPLLMEKKGLSLDGLDEAVNKTKTNIDTINEEVESLLED